MVQNGTKATAAGAAPAAAAAAGVFHFQCMLNVNIDILKLYGISIFRYIHNKDILCPKVLKPKKEIRWMVGTMALQDFCQLLVHSLQISSDLW
jgi:hypothetical protein